MAEEKLRKGLSPHEVRVFEALRRSEPPRPYANFVGRKNVQFIKTVVGNVDSLMKECGIEDAERYRVIDALWANFRMALSYVGMPKEREDAKIVTAIIGNVEFVLDSVGIVQPRKSLILEVVEKHANGALKYIRKEEARVALRQ